MSHANISLFVPNVGCPHRCSFCDQKSITGTAVSPKGEDVDSAVRTAVSTFGYCPENTEIAFFGGSFTAIEREYMLELLLSAGKYVKNGTVGGIRVSTRPDAINDEILDILKDCGVTAVELGAQSMCDEVLLANGRGHSSDMVDKASALIKQYGISLGLQMMTGLYKSTPEKDIYTASRIIENKPDTVRIYPTITLKNTLLAKLYKSGEYIPPTLDEAISLCTEIIEMFEKSGINIIRTGLHSIDETAYVAGPWHPSFRELCDSKRYLNLFLSELKEKGKINIFVAPKEISKAVGQKKKNISVLNEHGYLCKIRPLDGLKPFEFRLERMNNSCT